MGLDMYLTARKAIYQREWAPEGQPVPVLIREDGMKVTGYEMEAAYWRKHPNLHGFIVSTFGPRDEHNVPDDNCQPIRLETAALRVIAAAIRANDLPHTSGFFFGDSDWHKDNVEADAQKFDDLADWLEATPKRDDLATEQRSAEYCASW